MENILEESPIGTLFLRSDCILKLTARCFGLVTFVLVKGEPFWPNKEDTTFTTFTQFHEFYRFAELVCI